MAFDVPFVRFKDKPFEERYKHLLVNVAHKQTLVVSIFVSLFSHSLFTPHPPFFYINLTMRKQVAARTMAKSEAHMKFILHGVLEDAGEGLIARKVGSLYEHGRTSSLLKIKVCLFFTCLRH